jgi:hypothetical protein
MNNVFEKFKDFALTEEQTSQVRGGQDWCKVWKRCYVNVVNLAESISDQFDGFNEFSKFIGDLTDQCDGHFAELCASS